MVCGLDNNRTIIKTLGLHRSLFGGTSDLETDTDFQGMKFHLLSHLVHFIEEYGSPEGWDASSFEMAQKIFVKIPFRKVAPSMLGLHPYYVQAKMLKLVLDKQWLELAKRVADQEEREGDGDEEDERDGEEEGAVVGSGRGEWTPHSGYARYDNGLFIIGEGEAWPIKYDSERGWFEQRRDGSSGEKPWPEQENPLLRIDQMLESYHSLPNDARAVSDPSSSGVAKRVKRGGTVSLREGVCIVLEGGSGKRFHVRAGKGGRSSLVRVNRLSAFGSDSERFGDVVEVVVCLEFIGSSSSTEEGRALHLLGVRTCKYSDLPDYNGIDSRVFYSIPLVGEYRFIRADAVIGGVIGYSSHHSIGDKKDLSIPKVVWVMNHKYVDKVGPCPLQKSDIDRSIDRIQSYPMSEIARALLELAKQAVHHV